jgi:hypothetical protein
MPIEVTLGADSSKSTTTQKTTINLVPAETANNFKIYGALIGAVCGGAYSKYKGHRQQQSH